MTQQKRSTVVTLLANGVSQHEIHRKTGIDRKTIRKIAREMVAPPANSPMATGSGGVDVQIPPPRPPAPVAAIRSACEPYRDWIEAQIRLGRNAMAIYQDLVDQHGFLRMSGCVLNSTDVIHWRILAFLGAQLQIRAPRVTSLRALYPRRPTLHEHQQLAKAQLGFKNLIEPAQRILVGHLRQTRGASNSN